MNRELIARLRIQTVFRRAECGRLSVEDYRQAVTELPHLPEPDRAQCRAELEDYYAGHAGVAALKAMASRVELARRVAARAQRQRLTAVRPLVPIVEVHLPEDMP